MTTNVCISRSVRTANRVGASLRPYLIPVVVSTSAQLPCECSLYLEVQTVNEGGPGGVSPQVL